MNNNAIQDIQRAINIIRDEVKSVDDETKWAVLELMLDTSSTIISLANKKIEPAKSMVCVPQVPAITTVVGTQPNDPAQRYLINEI
jgi:hypothetical protein